MGPAVSNAIPSTPNSILRGDLTFSPFFRFLKNTRAPAGTSGNGGIDAVVSMWCMEVSVAAVLDVSLEEVLSPDELQAIIPTNSANGKKLIFFMLNYILKFEEYRMKDRLQRYRQTSARQIGTVKVRQLRLIRLPKIVYRKWDRAFRPAKAPEYNPGKKSPAVCRTHPGQKKTSLRQYKLCRRYSNNPRSHMKSSTGINFQRRRLPRRSLLFPAPRRCVSCQSR